MPFYNLFKPRLNEVTRMLSEKGKQLRRCQAFTLGGYGDRCKHWAESYTDYCNLHNGRMRQYPDEEEQVNRRLFPLTYKKSAKHRLCHCSAYPFPHFRSMGLCQWPDPPESQLVITDKTSNEETKLKKKLRKLGIH